MIGAIVLAAGRSSRMGANKLIAALEGQPIIRHIVGTLAAAGLARPMVVLGNKEDEVRRALAGLSVDFMVAQDFEKGIGHSIRSGISATPKNWHAVLICLGDMPKVGVATIMSMLAVAQNDRIIVPVWQGKRGNPILWGRNFFEQLQSLEGDVGGRQILARNADRITEIAADGPGILHDIDTPNDLKSMRKPASP